MLHYCLILFSIIISQKMNFNLSRNLRPINTASQQYFRGHLSYANSPLNQSTPFLTPKVDKNIKFESTNYKNFKQQEQITEQNQIEVLKLIKVIPPNPFVTITDLNKLEFSPLCFTVNQLIKQSKMIIDANSERKLIGKSFNLHKLIELIAQNYLDVSYHNFTHAFSLMQALFQCYNRSVAVKKSITEKQWFYVLISALAHDLNHPGTNNAFQIKAKTQHALQSNNESVLEKMHLNIFWSILRKNSQVNFLQGYSKNESNEIKKLITRMILATDVSKHFKGLQTLQNHIKSKNPLQGENAIIVIQQLFHACDISNPCLNFENYMNWSALVSHQFNLITIKQEKLGLPITGFLKYQNMNKFYKGQIGFCNIFVLPLWKQLGNIYPGIQEFINNITTNIQKLQKLVKQTQ